MNTYGEDWRGLQSDRTWIHMCMGSEGCMVKETGDIRSRPRRIAYPITHVDADEIVDAHNRRLAPRNLGKNFEVDEVTECHCGKEIVLRDAKSIGLYWSHVETGLTACDPTQPLSWMHGQEFGAFPKARVY